MHDDEPKLIGSMFVEVNGDDGYHGVVEVAMLEEPNGQIHPGGIRDAITKVLPTRVPDLAAVREAMDLAKWCFLNQAVFQGRVSNVSVANWEIAGDHEPNAELGELGDDPELN